MGLSFKRYRIQVYVIGFVVLVSVISIVLMNILLAIDNRRLRKEIVSNRDSVVLERYNLKLKDVISKVEKEKGNVKLLDGFVSGERLFLLKIYNSEKKLIYKNTPFPFPKGFIKKLDPKKTSGELPPRGDFFFYRYSLYLGRYIDTLICFYPIFDKFGRVKYYIYYAIETPFRFPSDTMTQLIVFFQVLFIVSLIALIVYYLRRFVYPYEGIIKEVKKSKVVTTDINKAQDEVDFAISSFKEIISKLKEKEKELKLLHEKEKERADSLEKFFKDLIEGINTAIFIFNEKGIFLEANRPGLDIFKRNKIFFKNSKFNTVFSSFPDVVKKFEDTYRSKSPSVIEDVTIGGKIWRITLLPFFSLKSNFRGVISIFEDYTELSRLKEKLFFEKQLSQIGEMSAGIAHEFKNSLATISGYLQMLEGDLKPSSSKRFRSLMNEVENLNKVITDFLNFAKPLDFSKERFNVCDVIEEVLNKKKYDGVKITFQKIDCFELEGDRELFSRAIYNIIQNSFESFEDRDSDKNEIEVKIFQEKNEKFIEISDNGSGIEEKDIDKIFTPFFTTKPDGVGLGLSFVHKIAVLHGGSIDVKSKKGEGTRVKITFYS